MSHTIKSITYFFEPDKTAQALCEQTAAEIDGNGVSLSDITAESAVSSNVTVTSHFTWAIQVSLKSKTIPGKQTKNTVLHDSAAEAQSAAKKQGQHIIKNSLGKIELINNINEDPEHFFKHSSVKLNGGKSHALILNCSQQCNSGQFVCPRCKGKGTRKATTKKEDFLGTSGNVSSDNICPQCKGRGSIECSTCAGNGELTQLYQVHVDATRMGKDIVETEDKSVKQLLENFITRHSHKNLIKSYLSPTVTQLEDVDEKHCKVIYQSKTNATLLKLKVKEKNQTILGFGKQNICINKTHILDDTLLPAIDEIIGKHPRFGSVSKYTKLQSMPALTHILTSESTNYTDDQLKTLLHKYSHNLLSPASAQKIIEKIKKFKTTLTAKYNLVTWVAFTSAGLLSAFYFGLKLKPVTDTAILFGIHGLTVFLAGYYSSTSLTKRKRKKLAQNNTLPTLEKLPALISVTLILIALLAPKALSTENRWSIFFNTHQIYHTLFSKQTKNSAVISSPARIQLAQKHLTILGYANITENGEFDTETATAVKDFQNRFGIYEEKYINQKTMGLLTRYSVIRSSLFNDSKISTDNSASE